MLRWSPAAVLGAAQLERQRPRDRSHADRLMVLGVRLGMMRRAAATQVDVNDLGAGGRRQIANVEAGTFPKEMSVAVSSSTGVESPRASTSRRRGTPRTASQPSCDPAEQTAALLRRDVHGVGGLAGDVAGNRAAHLRVTHDPVETCLDLRNGRDAFVALAPVSPARGGLRREGALVCGPGSRVVHPEGATTDHYLRVAVLALDLEPQFMGRAGHPQPTGPAVQERVRALYLRAVDEVVRKAHPRRDPRDRRRLQRLMDSA